MYVCIYLCLFLFFFFIYIDFHKQYTLFFFYLSCFDISKLHLNPTLSLVLPTQSHTLTLPLTLVASVHRSHTFVAQTAMFSRSNRLPTYLFRMLERWPASLTVHAHKSKKHSAHMCLLCSYCCFCRKSC